MAQVHTRVNLAAMAFPFLSELNGRGIIVKQTDQNYVAQVTSKEDLDKDIGIPYLYYCHNIIPTSSGYESVDYLSIIAAYPSAATFVGIFPVIDGATGNKAYIGYDTTGNYYYSKDPYYSWTLFHTDAAKIGKLVTAGYINGVTYIYVANIGCYKFDFSTNTFASVTLTGLTAANILGIVAVQGYLLSWTSSAVAWSSLLDPTDFTPSLVTGAGGGSVQGAKGTIVACVNHTTGLVIYTNQNAVAAPASGNARYPFNFRELVNSGGLASLDLVTYDANSGNHYTYTTSGLQIVSLTQTQTIIPELTDFLAGSVFEDFDEVTNTLYTTNVSGVMKKKLSLVSDRYLIISYGIASLTHALIYDLTNKRWGKLKIDHVECFEFALLTAETVETPRRSIAFLQADGTVRVVKLDIKNTNANGVVLFGKYQYIRQRLCTLETVDIENVSSDVTNFSIYDWYSLNGKTPAGIKQGYLLDQGSLSRKYAFSVVGLNHSLLMKGAFNLTCIVIATAVHGRV